MGVQTAVQVIIGAELGNGFKGVFSSTEKQLGTLGNAIKKLDTTSKDITSFKQLRTDTVSTYQQWRSAEAEVKKLATAISQTDKPSKQLNNSFRTAKKEALLAKTAYQQNRTSLRELSASLKQAGVDTKNLNKEQSALGKALDTLRSRQSAMAAIHSKQQANLAQRASYRSQMMDVVSLGTSLYGLVKPAVAFESAMADVKKVIDFDSPEELRQMESEIKKLSETIPLTLEGLAQIVAAGGQLGVPKAELTSFAETAAQMSVAFDITADEAGQSMAKLSNVLQMPIREMSKVGDVINHLSNNIAATAPEIVEVNLRAGAMAKSFGLSYNEVSALAGTFVAMGKTPEIAGTAINMMASRLKLIPVSSGAARDAFDQLGISMEHYTELVESGKGTEAMLTVLEALTKIQGVKRSQIMKDMFGENANRHINSLVEGLDTLKANLHLVANETEYAGSMQREFAARSATTENNLQLLKNQMAVLATNVGATLLPAINSVVGIFGKAASSLAEFAEKHPTLVKYIGLAVAGMTSFKIASFALGYGFTFLKGGALAIIGVFSKVKTIFSVAKIALGAVIPVIKAVGTAFLTNPVGLIITGIAVGAALIIKYWKPISAFFKRLFEPVVQVFKQVWNWITNLWEKAKNIFNGVKEWVKDSWVGKAWNWAFGDDEEETEKPPKVGDTVSVINEMTNAAAPVELPQSKISSNNTSSVAISAPITINAAPGMSAEDVAAAVQTELNSRENQATRRTRSANYD